MRASCALPKRSSVSSSFIGPYHRALGQLLEATPQPLRHSSCCSIAIRCRRPPLPMSRTGQRGRVDVVLGDCHGTSCDPIVAETAHRRLTDKGYAVARNAPYAGGFTTTHYGKPEKAAIACRSRSAAASTWTSAATSAKPSSPGLPRTCAIVARRSPASTRRFRGRMSGLDWRRAGHCSASAARPISPPLPRSTPITSARARDSSRRRRRPRRGGCGAAPMSVLVWLPFSGRDRGRRDGAGLCLCRALTGRARPIASALEDSIYVAPERPARHRRRAAGGADRALHRRRAIARWSR